MGATTLASNVPRPTEMRGASFTVGVIRAAACPPICSFSSTDRFQLGRQSTFAEDGRKLRHMGGQQRVARFEKSQGGTGARLFRRGQRKRA